MTDALIGQIITGVVTLGLAFFGYLKLKAGQKNVETKVDDYHKDVNGMKTELVEAVRSGSLAIGKEAGISQQKNESSTTASDVVEAIKNDPGIDLTKNKP